MKIVLVLDNLRSAHNVGSILRTADAAGVMDVICIGTTPHPALPDDPRPGHVASRMNREIAKTALGAQESISISYASDLRSCLERLRSTGYSIAALEQAPSSINLFDYNSPEQLALVVGNEVAGVHLASLEPSDVILELPMRGTKESLNVSVATGIALYQLTQPKNRP